MHRRPKIVVVVPTYNERENITELARRLVALPVVDLHLLIVDDDSPDGTGSVADRLVREHPDTIHVLHRTYKQGLGQAYTAGMTLALAMHADIVIQMDADLSHPASVIPIMVAELSDGPSDVVIGSRYVTGGSVAAGQPLSRRVLSRGANWYVGAILRLRIKDATAGFKAWRADALRLVDPTSMSSVGYSFQVEANYLARQHELRVTELPIHFAARSDGVSKMSMRERLESARAPWRLLAKRGTEAELDLRALRSERHPVSAQRG